MAGGIPESDVFELLSFESKVTGKYSKLSSRSFAGDMDVIRGGDKDVQWSRDNEFM